MSSSLVITVHTTATSNINNPLYIGTGKEFIVENVFDMNVNVANPDTDPVVAQRLRRTRGECDSEKMLKMLFLVSTMKYIYILVNLTYMNCFIGILFFFSTIFLENTCSKNVVLTTMKYLYLSILHILHVSWTLFSTFFGTQVNLQQSHLIMFIKHYGVVV